MEFTGDGFLILTKLDVFVYNIPGEKTDKAKYWDLRDPIWSGNLLVLANNTDCTVRLLDESGCIFGVANVDAYPGNNLLPVTDSTRYFALRFSNRFYGIGFVTGDDSSVFINAVGDYLLKLREINYITDSDEVEIVDEIVHEPDEVEIIDEVEPEPVELRIPEEGTVYESELLQETRIPRARRKVRVEYEEENFPEPSYTGVSGDARSPVGNNMNSTEKCRAGDRLIYDSIFLRTCRKTKTCPACARYFRTFEDLQVHYITKHGPLEFPSENEKNLPDNGNCDDYSWLNLEEPARIRRPVSTPRPVHRPETKKKNKQKVRGGGQGNRKFKKKKGISSIFSPVHFVYSHDLLCVKYGISGKK